MFGGRPRSVWAGVLVALISFSGLPGLAAATIAGQTATSVKPAVEAPRPALNCPEVPPSGVGGRPPVGEMKVRVAVDAQTQWRPRRQAVIFTVAGVDFEANVGLFCTYFRWKDDPQPANDLGPLRLINLVRGRRHHVDLYPAARCPDEMPNNYRVLVSFVLHKQRVLGPIDNPRNAVPSVQRAPN